MFTTLLLAACSGTAPPIDVNAPELDSAVTHGPPAPIPCFPDADGDTYGDDLTSFDAESCPAGTVLRGGDCDDSDAQSHPGAMEVCDGADNDCDGSVDSPLPAEAPTWYADLDGDGFGDAASAQPACAAPVGFIAVGTDCDDTSAAASPGLAEVCEDGLDNDCAADGDGKCRLAGVIDLATAADAVLYGEEVSGGAGSVLVARDLDGDGRSTVVTSVWSETDRHVYTGRIYAFHDPLEDGLLDEERDFDLTPRDRWGTTFSGDALALLPDLDGDGCGELVVAGALDDVEAGSIWRFDGCASGWLDETSALGSGSGDLALQFGESLTPVDDSDGDGAAELLVGAPGSVTVDGEVRPTQGRAYLFLSPGATLDAAEATAVFDVPVGGSNLKLGKTTCSGDLDGDGLDDVGLGAPGGRPGGALDWASHGAVFVVFAPFGGVTALADEEGTPEPGIFMVDSGSENPAWSNGIGSSLVCHDDLDGDGRADLAYTDPVAGDHGVIFVPEVLGGGHEAPGETGWRIDGSGGDVKFFGTLPTGDVDGDGALDLLASVEENDGTTRQYLLYGPLGASTTTEAAGATITGLDTEAAVVTDLDGDGFTDIVAGAPSESTYADAAGACFILLGGDL